MSNDILHVIMRRYADAFKAANGRGVDLAIVAGGKVRVGTGGLEYSPEQIIEMTRKLDIRASHRKAA